MKKVMRIIGLLLAIVNISLINANIDGDPYLSGNILSSVQGISISKLLDFKTISGAIKDDFDKARFHYIISYEIDKRMQDLDNKFNEHEIKYRKTIGRYEQELDLKPYNYTNDRPRFDYTYQPAEITEDTISNNIIAKLRSNSTSICYFLYILIHFQ